MRKESPYEGEDRIACGNSPETAKYMRGSPEPYQVTDGSEDQELRPHLLEKN
jgi:hypothetical protein